MPSLLVTAAAASGAAAGTFLPRLAHRLAVPAGSPPRSACAVCARPFPSFVRAGAACRCSVRPWWAAPLLAATATGLLAAALGPSPVLATVLPAAVLGVLLALIDLRCLRLPDPLVAALALLLAPPAAFAGSSALLRATLAAGLVGAVYLAVALLPGDGLGLGDVKLATVLAFFLASLSWRTFALGIIAPHVFNGPIALALLLGHGRTARRRPLPFGPALLAGALAGVVLTT